MAERTRQRATGRMARSSGPRRWEIDWTPSTGSWRNGCWGAMGRLLPSIGTTEDARNFGAATVSRRGLPDRLRVHGRGGAAAGRPTAGERHGATGAHFSQEVANLAISQGLGTLSIAYPERRNLARVRVQRCQEWATLQERERERGTSTSPDPSASRRFLRSRGLATRNCRPFSATCPPCTPCQYTSRSGPRHPCAFGPATCSALIWRTASTVSHGP